MASNIGKERIDGHLRQSVWCDVNVALNALVRDGAIKSYRTDRPARAKTGISTVFISLPPAQADHGEILARQALEPFTGMVTLVFDAENGRGYE